MVKFAEAEKRGRGGEGGDRRYPPVVLLERPKMSRAMWESLKAHIIRDRKRKKEEQEADAEEERLRKERENRKKQHAMTLEETRDTIVKMEQGLTDLKNQKHQLFQDLKVVLNEDATRKRAQQQQNYLKESEMMVPPYPHGIPMTGHPQMLFQSNLVPGRSTLPLHAYKVPQAQPQPLIPPGSMKRSRTPSPPPQPGYQQIPYNFKNLSGHPPPSVPVSLPTTTTHVSALHQPLDHKGKPTGGAFLPPGEGAQEKYFQPTVRSHLPLHSGVLPVQQPHPGGGKGGSITSGFPVRTAPPSSQPPSPVVSSAPHASKPDTKPRSYSNQHPNYTRSFY
ncbi:G protein pathway suppressor 2 isoform X2 [Penaeus vannamei]|uniref:G protein pathway suppressor 2 isoform X2 n=1 Tax=Penaeus vannamei TaxID=6689 RepID=UPI00387F6062